MPPLKIRLRVRRLACRLDGDRLLRAYLRDIRRAHGRHARQPKKATDITEVSAKIDKIDAENLLCSSECRGTISYCPRLREESLVPGMRDIFSRASYDIYNAYRRRPRTGGCGDGPYPRAICASNSAIAALNHLIWCTCRYVGGGLPDGPSL